MTETNRASALHWADAAAQNIIRKRGDLDVYTCASGITPSGVVHIGNFREIISVDLVVRALRAAGKNARFIYSWDDYDVFRKVPPDMPSPEALAGYLRLPITRVPDPWGGAPSYARRHELAVEAALPRVGIRPEYLYQAERYRAHCYDEGIQKALRERAAIKDCLNRFRDAAHKIPEDEEYWPVSVFCEHCGKDTTAVESFDGEWGLGYACASCGAREVIDIREASGVKLGWRVDWPMRWAYERTVFEPAGKDHHSRGGSFDTARLVSEEVYGWPAPETFQYDFIGVKGAGGKMSSSAGGVITLDDVLQVYQPEVARYLFAGTRPNTEFAIGFDLDVLKTYEDYDKTERIAWGAEKAKSDEAFQKEKRIYELSQTDGMPPVMPYQTPFRHLCNLLQTAGEDAEAALAALPGVLPEQEARLRARAECALNWLRRYAPEEFRFALRDAASPPEGIGEAALPAVRAVRERVLPAMDGMDEPALSRALYAQAEEAGIEPRALFRAMYRALIGKDQGPRLAGFMKIIGRERLEGLLGAV